MKTILSHTWPQFFTATVAEWRPLFEADKYKDIIIGSLQFLVKNNKIILYGFVIMKNHIHVIWQGLAGENTRPGHPLQNNKIILYGFVIMKNHIHASPRPGVITSRIGSRHFAKQIMIIIGVIVHT